MLRLLHLVFQGNLDGFRPGVFGDFANAVDQPLPLFDVVGSQRIIVTVLARPKVQQAAVQFHGDIRERLQLRHGILASRGVGRGQRTLAPFLTGEQVGDD